MVYSFLRLVRWKNLLIIALTVCCLEFLAIPSALAWNPTFWHMLLGTICIAAAGNIINDIRDYEIDIINKPQKVIIHKDISATLAWVSYSLFNIVALVVAWVGNQNWLLYSFSIAIILLFLYSFYFKKMPLIGNLIVALLCAWVVVNFAVIHLADFLNHPYCTSSHSIWLELLGYYTFFAFWATLAREIVKDLQDQKGDQLHGANTLPIWLGQRVAKYATLAVLGLLFLSLLLEAQFLYNREQWLAFTFLIVILLPILLAIIWKIYANNYQQVVYATISQYLKWYFLLGLVLLFLIQK